MSSIVCSIIMLPTGLNVSYQSFSALHVFYHGYTDCHNNTFLALRAADSSTQEDYIYAQFYSTGRSLDLRLLYITVVTLFLHNR